MTTRFAAALVLAAVAGTIGVSAQRPAPHHPDLQGLWTNGTVTPLTRPAAFKDKAVFTAEEAAEWEKGALQRFIAVVPPEDAAMGSDLNDIYLDTRSLKVVPDRRTSLIVDPPDGRLPEPLPQVKTRADARPKRSYDDPETVSLDERCLMGTMAGSSQLAPPMVPNVLAQNYYQIVQTEHAVLIYTEVVHDARVIRIGGTHPPAAIQKWLGDSIGHYEGSALVVDTINFRPESHNLDSGERLHVVERFSRVDATTLRYRVTVDDPDTWATPWTAEWSLRSSNAPLYGVDCHEGNYAIENFLRGARAEEQRAKTPPR